jgi:hypothetical protein
MLALIVVCILLTRLVCTAVCIGNEGLLLAERAYPSWLDRLYLIDRVAYKAGPGPFGFHPKGVEETLQKLVPSSIH